MSMIRWLGAAPGTPVLKSFAISPAQTKLPPYVHVPVSRVPVAPVQPTPASDWCKPWSWQYGIDNCTYMLQPGDTVSDLISKYGPVKSWYTPLSGMAPQNLSNPYNQPGVGDVVTFFSYSSCDEARRKCPNIIGHVVPPPTPHDFSKFAVNSVPSTYTAWCIASWLIGDRKRWFELQKANPTLPVGMDTPGYYVGTGAPTHVFNYPGAYLSPYNYGVIDNTARNGLTHSFALWKGQYDHHEQTDDAFINNEFPELRQNFYITDIDIGNNAVINVPASWQNVVPVRYTTKDGDTTQSIAKDFTGDRLRFPELVFENACTRPTASRPYPDMPLGALTYVNGSGTPTYDFPAGITLTIPAYWPGGTPNVRVSP